MSRQPIPPSRSFRAGKRGRHKHMTSAETLRWNREHLIPEQPPWMDAETYRKLARLRTEIEHS